MYSYVDGDGELVEPEGVNAGGPVDRGPAARDREEPTSGAQLPGGGCGGPAHDRQGQGQGELLSQPGSQNGVTGSGPGQEVSAEEG